MAVTYVTPQGEFTQDFDRYKEQFEEYYGEEATWEEGLRAIWGLPKLHPALKKSAYTPSEVA